MASLRVLVATANPGLAALARRAAERAGAEASSVSSAKEALAAAHASVYDALIADMHLPECGGLKLAITLRGNGSKLPVVLLVEDETPCVRAWLDRLGAARSMAIGDLARLEEVLRDSGSDSFACGRS